jgi:hypothetical protein
VQGRLGGDRDDLPGLVDVVAPRAKSTLPSPSMSCGWMQTLSRSVTPLVIVCFSQPGLANQTTASSVTATTSSLPSPSTSAVVTA